MAYSETFGFSFAPTRSNPFDPSNPKNTSSQPNPYGVDPNPYVPSCSNNATLEKINHGKQYMEIVKNYGQRIAYQPVAYSMNTHNFLYGEDPTSGYHYARYMKAIVDFSSYNTFMTKFGIMSDADIIIYVPIAHFEEVWGTTLPLAGDIFYIVDSACDRPYRQSPMVFEVTEKHDSINPVDYMGGHYVWKLTARRYDYSYEPRAAEEHHLGGPEDSGAAGRLEGGENPPDEYKKDYPQTNDETAKEDFDNSIAGDSVYGKYL